MTNKPLAKRVLLKELPKDEKTDSGLYIPDSVAQAAPLSKAVVLDIGKDCEEILKNDEVLFDSGAGTPVVINKEDCRLVREDNVVMILTRNGHPV